MREGTGSRMDHIDPVIEFRVTKKGNTVEWKDEPQE